MGLWIMIVFGAPNHLCGVGTWHVAYISCKLSSVDWGMIKMGHAPRAPQKKFILGAQSAILAPNDDCSFSYDLA